MVWMFDIPDGLYMYYINRYIKRDNIIASIQPINIIYYYYNIIYNFKILDIYFSLRKKLYSKIRWLQMKNHIRQTF